MSNKNLHYGSVDGQFEAVRLDKDFGEPNNRDFAYMVIGGGRFVTASLARLMVIKLVGNFSPSRAVLALGSAEFDINSLPVGQSMVVKWRGKPIFVKHRSAEDIAKEEAVDITTLVDPQTDAQRVQDAEWLIVVGICTHLGCVPVANAGDFGGWFCPCHGSHYDGSGRIRKGPAPLNLEIPPYTLNDGHLVVG